MANDDQRRSWFWGEVLNSFRDSSPLRKKKTLGYLKYYFEVGQSKRQLLSGRLGLDMED